MYDKRVEIEEQYVSIVDDNTFPQQRFAPIVPLSIKLLHRWQIVGSSGCLLCFYGYYLDSDCRKEMVVLWKQEVMVYTLSSGEWRTQSCNLLRQSIEVTWDLVVIDRFIYWLALDRIVINDELFTSSTIMSFDMTTDEFRQIYLPDSLASPYDETTTPKDQMTISKEWESLAVLEYNMDIDKMICVVWMMDHGVPKSFTKLFTIKTPHASIEALGFRKSGEPIIKTLDYFEYFIRRALVVYEPYSEHINNLGISGLDGTLSVNSYMETLLLLNQ